jgi:hypothetical protein
LGILISSTRLGLGILISSTRLGLGFLIPHTLGIQTWNCNFGIGCEST